MKQVKIMKKISMVMVLAFIGASSLVALDVPTFYRIDLNTSQLTLNNSKSLLECLQRACLPKEQEEIRSKSQQEILDLYMDANTTPSKYLGFYMKNMKEIQEFYQNRVTVQDVHQSIYQEIENINRDISVLMEQQIEQQKIEEQTEQQK